MAITDWPTEERPRERLLSQGAKNLSDAELLAIFLRVGCRGKSAVDLGRDLIDRFSSLNRLFTASRSEIASVPGLGNAKYAQLQAVLEMSRRALKEELQQGILFDSPQAVADYLRLSIAHLPHEVFLGLWLNAQNRLIACDELFHGTLSETSVYPREVVKTALRHNASAVIFAHNHPSGQCEPSQADKKLTRTLTQALALVDVRVHDHFIVANGTGAKTHASFAELGLL